MKKITFLLLTLCSLLSLSAQSWSPLTTITSRNLHEVQVVNDNTIYAISSTFYRDNQFGMNDILLRSFDGGMTWDSTSIAGTFVQGLHFINDSVGMFAGGMPSCGMAPTVLKTTDKGLGWDGWTPQSVWVVPMTVGMGYSAAYFWEADKGYVFGGNWGGKQYTTQDNGFSWTETASFHAANSYPNIFFFNQNEGYVVSDSVVNVLDAIGNVIGYNSFGYIYKTTNGGSTWTEQAFPNDSLSDVNFPSNNIGYVAAGTHLLKTTDAGISWSSINLSFSALKTAFINNNYGFIVAKDGNIYKTVDGGNNWTLDYTGNFLGIDVKNGIAIAVGKNGSIVKLNRTNALDSKEMPKQFQLFPNPSAQMIQIKGSENVDFTVEVYNALGQILFDSKGNTLLQLNIATLTHGTYFFHIKDKMGKTLQIEKVVKN